MSTDRDTERAARFAEEACKRVGARLRTARVNAGLTQAEVAALIEVGRSSVANMEAGRQELTVSRLAILASVLEVDLAGLVGEGEAPPPHKVTIRLRREVWCETCQEEVDLTADREQAEASRRTHVATWQAKEARTP